MQRNTQRALQQCRVVRVKLHQLGKSLDNMLLHNMPRKCDAVFVSCCCCSRTTTWTHSTSSCKRSGSIRQVGAAGGLPAVADIAAQLSAVHAAEADGACALLRHAQAYLRESCPTRPSSSASVVAVARAAHASVTWLASIGPARTHVMHTRMHAQTCIGTPSLHPFIAAGDN